jgi:hypothetical protein
MEASETKPVAGQGGADTRGSETAWSFWLVFSAIGWVTAAFLIVMFMYSRLDICNESNVANITAALSSLFGIVGTLVGAYFGIKATAEAQGKVERAQHHAAQKVSDTADKALTTVDTALTNQTAVVEKVTTAPASTGTAQRPTSASSIPLTLATLIPLAGTAGLLIYRYVKRAEDA